MQTGVVALNLHPEWKKELTSCLRKIGLLDEKVETIVIDVNEYKVSTVTKSRRYR